MSSLTNLKAQSVIDSLEHQASKVKQGWDQIDMAIGLARLYTNAAYFDKAREEINNIYKWSEINNLPIGKSYALTIEGCIADLSLDDADTGIMFFEKAISIARKEKNKEALTYASTELCKILIWNKGDTKKGITILFDLLGEIDETVSKKNEGTIHFALGHAYMLEGSYEKSLEYFNKALVNYQEIVNNPVIDSKINRISAQFAQPMKHIGFVLNDIGNLYLKKGNTIEAVSYKKKAFEAIQKTNTLTHMAWMHVNMCKIYSSLGDYATALDYIKTARELYESRKLYTDIAWVDAVMTSLFFNMKDYVMAEVYCKKNLDYLEKANPNSHYYGGTLLRMVEIQFKKENLTLASYYLKRAKRKIKKSDNSENKALMLRFKGEIALKREKYDEAKKAFNEAKVLNKMRGSETEIAICEYNLAITYFHKSELESSIFYANKALYKAEELKKVNLAKQCYAFLSKVYEYKGDYKSAYKNQKSFLVYSNGLYTKDAVGKLKKEQVRQEVDGFKKEKELAEENASLLAERNQLYIIWAAILLFFSVMMFYLYIKLRKIKAKIQSKNKQLKQLNETKDKFFGIIAHDIRSPLLGLQSVGNQISYFIRKEQPDKLVELSGHIEDSTKKLTNLLDNLLNWALLQNGMIPYHPEKVSLKLVVDDVIDLLKPISKMKEIRIINSIKEESCVYADTIAVNTILRNLISNALKYTTAKGEVKIEVKNKENKFLIIINDNGTGIAADKIPKLFDLGNKSIDGTIGEEGSGLGLILCKELVELNKGTIKVISDLGKGSSFIFNLPKTATSV